MGDDEHDNDDRTGRVMASAALAGRGERSFFVSEFGERLALEGPERLRGPLREWLRANGARRDANFVYCAWLSATHEPEFVRREIGVWI